MAVASESALMARAKLSYTCATCRLYGQHRTHRGNARVPCLLCVEKHTVGEGYPAKKPSGNWKRWSLGPNSGEKVSKWAARSPHVCSRRGHTIGSDCVMDTEHGRE